MFVVRAQAAIKRLWNRLLSKPTGRCELCYAPTSERLCDRCQLEG